MSAVAFTKLEKSECGPSYEDWISKGFFSFFFYCFLYLFPLFHLFIFLRNAKNNKGYHGEMGYLAREDAVAKRKDPTRVVPGAVSAIVATINYDPDLGMPFPLILFHLLSLSLVISPSLISTNR